jgi:hypothetical protein
MKLIQKFLNNRFKIITKLFSVYTTYTAQFLNYFASYGDILELQK